MKKRFLFFLLVLLFSLPAYAQQTIQGKVTDVKTGEPLVGVNVVVKSSTSNGTISDLNGNYRLRIYGFSSVSPLNI